MNSVIDLHGKSVAVYGLGVSGLGALKFLAHRGLEKLVIVNKGKPEEWKNQLPHLNSSFSHHYEEGSSQAIDELAAVDFILLAPGIPRTSLTLRKALENKIPIWNELELASRFFSRPILALTGTNGKTTSVSFMAEVMKHLGVNAFVGGNIGRSFLEGLESGEKFDLALLEVSSFQCESLDKMKPCVAGILNLFPNHGERYSVHEDYRQAKWLLCHAQGKDDHFYIGPGCKEPVFKPSVQIHRISEEDSQRLSEEFNLNELKIVGAHNRFNLWFCWQMLKAFSSKLKRDEEEMKAAFQKAIGTFSGVANRIEYIGENKKYLIYNDAKSTNWEATVTAIKAMREKKLPMTLIIGGQLRGHNDTPSASVMEELKDCEVFLFGESQKVLRTINPYWRCFEGFGEIISHLKENEQESKTQEIILLSPAFPSFDQFSHYVERGDFFREKARELLKDV